LGDRRQDADEQQDQTDEERDQDSTAAVVHRAFLRSVVRRRAN
jgi:hypothetical protein